MLSDEQIRREAVSRIFLSQRSEEEKSRLEAEILEKFTTPGNGFSPSEMDEHHLLITRLADCGYIGFGVDRNLEETYRTTDSGRKHLAYLREMLGRSHPSDPTPSSQRGTGLRMRAVQGCLAKEGTGTPGSISARREFRSSHPDRLP